MKPTLKVCLSVALGVVLIICLFILADIFFTPKTPAPTATPTGVPTDVPTALPTDTPTVVPTDAPTAVPTDAPTDVPTDTPTDVPTDVPTDIPTNVPTAVPTDTPTVAPTIVPTVAPTVAPSKTPAKTATAAPVKTPSATPATTVAPSGPMLEGNVPGGITVENFNDKTNEDISISNSGVAEHTVASNSLKLKFIKNSVVGDWFQFNMKNKGFLSRGKDGFAFYAKNDGADVCVYFRLDVIANNAQNINLFLNVTEASTYVLFPADGGEPLFNNSRGGGWNGALVIPADFEGYVFVNFDNGFIQEGTGKPFAKADVKLEDMVGLVFFLAEGKANTTLYIDAMGCINYDNIEDVVKPTPTPTPASTPVPTPTPLVTPGPVSTRSPYDSALSSRDYTYMWWPRGFGDKSQVYIQTGYYALQWSLKESNADISKLGLVSANISQDKAALYDNATVESMPSSSSAWSVTVGNSSGAASAYNGVIFGSNGSESGNLLKTNIARLVTSGTFMQQAEIPQVSFRNLSGIRGWLSMNASPRFLAVNLRITDRNKALSNASMQYTLTLDSRFNRVTNNGSSVTLLSSDGTGFTISGVSVDRNVNIAFSVSGTSVTMTASNMSASGPDVYTSATMIITPVSSAVPSDTILASQVQGSVAVSYARLNSNGSRPSMQTSFFDANRGMYCIPLTACQINTANEADHHKLNRVYFTVTNSSNKAVTIPLAFDGGGKIAHYIVGGCPMLRDANTGEPVGTPIQISKNWHDATIGEWYKLYTMVSVPAKSTIELEFSMTTSKWGSAYAVHHSQLCLVGYGGAENSSNWLWDESGIGCNGESITYDKDMCLGRSMIDDVRPFLTLGADNRQWWWSGNVGGADFLVYYDNNNNKQMLVGVKNNYIYYGPNLTKVVYAGRSADGKIDAEITMQLCRTDDVVRAYYTVEYKFLQDVRYNRLAFFHAAADGYSDNRFTKFAYSSDGSTIAYSGSYSGTNGQYHPNHRSMEVNNDAWFFSYDSTNRPEENGNVLTIFRSYDANINGTQYTKPFMSIFTNGQGTTIPSVELSPPAQATRRIRAGSSVKAVIEYVIVPGNKAAYYGNSDYLLAMTAAEMNSPTMAIKQAMGNKQTVNVTVGTLVRSYPNVIKASNNTAQFTLSGGLGYVPVTFTGLSRYDGFVLQYRDGMTWKTIDQSSAAEHSNLANLKNQVNDFWQCYHNTVDDTYELTFNVVAKSGTTEYRLIRK